MNVSASAPTPAPAAAHLLLVDDDRLILATLSRGLRDMGYQVSTAESVDDAEALLTGGLRPDLAIVDVRMPGRDGLELVERLRNLEHIPFLMLSAFSDTQNVERASGFGALGYLVKPMDVVQIRPSENFLEGNDNGLRVGGDDTFHLVIWALGGNCVIRVHIHFVREDKVIRGDRLAIRPDKIIPQC